ncbi:MAG TPA: hypothetical protein VN924_23630 [Bryobacteraceae bacterium]|nr:hypothetical protein [Bryobacteraceae bacterium]
MRRVDCRGCEAVVVEELPWGDGKHTLTNAYMLFLARWARRISWKETAEPFHTSWEKVFDAVEHVVTFGLGHRTLGRIDAIGVDEIQYAKGHKYPTLVYQIDLDVTRLLRHDRRRSGLERDEDAPQYVQQWLGYFLLFIEGREGDSIKHSLEFHRRFPDESDGLFNAACGYAQLYAIELRDHGVKEIQTSENRMRSLSFLEEAVRLDPGSRSIALKVSEPGDSFESLASDVDFLQIVGDARVPGGTKNANGSS